MDATASGGASRQLPFNEVSDFKRQQAAEYIVLASCSAVIWHWWTTFDDEIRFIWQAKSSTTRTLFLINRYMSLVWIVARSYVLFVDNITISFCQAWDWFSPWWFVFQIFVGEFALVLRVLALHPRDKKARITLICAYPATLIVGVIMLGLLPKISPENTLTYPTFGVSNGCISDIDHESQMLWCPLIPMIVLEMVLLSLSVRKIMNTPRSEKAAPILSNLTRDGLLVFASTLTCLVLAMLNSVLGDPIGHIATASMAVATMSISCSHILLSVKLLSYNLSKMSLAHAQGVVELDNLRDITPRNPRCGQQNQNADSDRYDSLQSNLQMNPQRRRDRDRDLDACLPAALRLDNILHPPNPRYMREDRGVTTFINVFALEDDDDKNDEGGDLRQNEGRVVSSRLGVWQGEAVVYPEYED